MSIIEDKELLELTEEIGRAITENIADVYNSDDIDAAWAAAISAAQKGGVV